MSRRHSLQHSPGNGCATSVETMTFTGIFLHRFDAFVRSIITVEKQKDKESRNNIKYYLNAMRVLTVAILMFKFHFCSADIG